MPIQADDVATLNAYAQGVMNRANHHAAQVQAIALAVLGGIIWRCDPGTIEIKQYAGNLANVLWVSIGGNRYAFAYNHTTGEIETRDRTQNGNVLHRFTNATPITDLEAIFRSL